MGNNSSEAVLLIDIDLSELSFVIGSVQTPYMGTFDGCGKTVNNLNLHVTHNGHRTFRKSLRCSGTLLVENCIYTGTINSHDSDDSIGGIQGYANADVTIKAADLREALLLSPARAEYSDM